MTEAKSMEKLMTEAQLRYPIGTKFRPAHLGKKGEIYTVTGGWCRYGLTHIQVTVKEKKIFTPLIYHGGNWAEIVCPAEPLESIVNNSYSIF